MQGPPAHSTEPGIREAVILGVCPTDVCVTLAPWGPGTWRRDRGGTFQTHPQDLTPRRRAASQPTALQNACPWGPTLASPEVGGALPGPSHTPHPGACRAQADLQMISAETATAKWCLRNRGAFYLIIPNPWSLHRSHSPDKCPTAHFSHGINVV